MNTFMTHLPMLKAIPSFFADSWNIKIRKVLEFGSGVYSTDVFLNKEVYPDLIHLSSYEDDPTWIAVLEKKNDRRLKILLPANYNATINTVAIKTSWDLIFVDSNKTAQERSKVILDIANNKPKCLVVIHDFEVPEYQEASKKFNNRIIFNGLTPHTALLWNEDKVIDENLFLEAIKSKI